MLDRIATLQPGTPMWPRFGTLILAYAILVVIGQAAYRMSGWLEWEGSLKTFANGVHRSFERLLRLGYRWHIDHPPGEVASSLSAFSWALIDGIDNLHWGVLRIIIVVHQRRCGPGHSRLAGAARAGLTYQLSSPSWW